jgi:ribosomal protein S18 acetylase RimI-like enzyme
MRRCYHLSVGHRATATAHLRAGMEGTWWLTNLHVPVGYRGEGYGRALLERVCEDADYYDVALRLDARPSGGLDYAALVAWYERCGFVQDNDGYYTREPQCVTSRSS